MDDRSELERARTKAFHNLLVERLGAEAWAKRKADYMQRIRDIESNFDIRLPIEPQLFIPADDDIDWYIFAAFLSHDFKHCDYPYSSRRIFSYAMAIGAVAEKLRNVPHINHVLDTMLANNNQPEKQIFELLTASFYIKNGYEVFFIPEGSIEWPDGKTKKSPDMLVRSGDLEFYVECKRADKQTKFSQSENAIWDSIWERLNKHMLRVAPWSTADVTFHEPLADVYPERVIQVFDEAMKKGSSKAADGSISIAVKAIDKKSLKAHYSRFSVKPNSPQQEQLVFGYLDANEKRSMSTLAGRVVRAGEMNILNMYVKTIKNCVGAQWRCDNTASLGSRSRHFKGLVNDGVSQIPPGKAGIVHIWYETRDGIEIEELRRDKNIESITSYDATGSTALGVFLHGVNYYPFEEDYEIAETVDFYGRMPGLFDLFPHQTLMLPADTTDEIPGISHWEQDRVKRQLFNS